MKIEIEKGKKVEKLNMTIRDEIRAISTRLQTPDNLSPFEAAELRVKATSLLSSLNAYIALKRHEYGVELYQYSKQEKSVAAARIRAQAGDKHKEWIEAEAQGEALLETIRALKDFVRQAEEERKLT